MCVAVSVAATPAAKEPARALKVRGRRRHGGIGDKDVAPMMARYAGATLGLFAFVVAITAGLFTQNPPMVILSRATLALFMFFGIGLVLGTAARIVVAEHERRRDEQIRQGGEADAADPTEEDAEDTSTQGATAAPP